MPALLEKPIGPVAPTEEESALAQESSRQLSRLLDHPHEFGVQTRDGGEVGERIVLPRAAVRLLAEILTQMAQGNAITLIPVHAELTTQQAADLLNVSRPFLVKLLEQDRLPFRKVGKHRRIRFSDVLRVKQQHEAQRAEALQRLVDEGQDLNLGY